MPARKEPPAPSLDLPRDVAAALHQRLAALLAELPAAFAARPIAAHAVAPPIDYQTPAEPLALFDDVVRALFDGQVQAGHPRYFGMFHPPTTTMSIVADALVAAFNPQLATASHAAYAASIERRLIGEIGTQFGYDAQDIEGTFVSGGAEANVTALLAALQTKFPEIGRVGLRGLPAGPRLYVSSEVHPTMARAARMAGLALSSARVIPVDANGAIKVGPLRSALTEDRRSGHAPFLIVGSVGTTSAAAIDPLGELADVAKKAGVWLHVDAAWGGLLGLLPEFRDSIAGIERADSITFDAHKALAVPMAAGLYLSRRKGTLARVFDQRAGYMPRDASDDPYAHGAQWSRRFIGLKLHMSLAVAGWETYRAALRHQIRLGAYLCNSLAGHGFSVVNRTPLPLVCFVDATRSDGDRNAVLAKMARAVLEQNAGWISVTRFSSGKRALRACIASYRTTRADVDQLVATLVAAREKP